MRRLNAAVGTMLAVTWATSAIAQAPDMFKDLDPNQMHWAYMATENLRKRNIIWGYPDGYFRGKRTLTRYEFTVALDRALQSIPMPGAGLRGEQGPQGPTGPAGPAGPAGQQGPPGMAPAELAEFRRLLGEFRTELASLGNTVGGINRKLDALGTRVGGIEDALSKMPKLYGGAFVGFRSDRAHGGFVDHDGRVFGVGGPGGSGLLSPVAVNQFLLGVTANIPGGGTLDAAITSNNYKNYLGGSFATIRPFNTTPDADTYIHHLELKTPFPGLGRDSNITIGRFGEKISKLTLWKPDVDRDFRNPFQDDGKYYMDGVRLSTNFGSVRFEGFGAQTKANTGVNGGPLNSPIAGTSIVGGLGNRIFNSGGGMLDKPFGQAFLGQMEVDQLAGLTLKLPIRQLQGGDLRLTAMNLWSNNSPGIGFDTVQVFGADFDLKITDRIKFGADWAKSGIL